MKTRYILPSFLLALLPLFCLLAAQQGTSKQDKPLAPIANGSHFADLVRADFFAGMMGDQSRFERAMQLIGARLKKNPQDPEAMVWYGSGLLVRSGQLAKKGDFQDSRILFQKGLDEMSRAVALAPDRLSVLLPQGATLLSVSTAPVPPDLSKRLLEEGVQDYEKVLKLQAPYFETLPLHARGELLSGLADGWHRLGDDSKAREYYQRIVKDCAGSVYAARSETWLKNALPRTRRPACQGCHTN